MPSVLRAIPVAFALLAGTLSGCATAPKPTGTDTEAFASRLIADHVQTASTAQRDYTAWMSAQRQDATQRNAALGVDTVDVDFIGPPSELLRAFALRYGLRFVTLGHREHARVVNVRMTRTAPLDVIRNVSQQIAPEAEVVLDESEKTVRLIYRG